MTKNEFQWPTLFCLPPFAAPKIANRKFETIRAKSPERYDCNPGRPLQESPGPSRPGIPKESPKSSPGPSGPGVQNVSETVSKQSPESQNRLFRESGDCFEIGPRAGRPWTTLWRLFRDSEGPGDSCKGRLGMQRYENRFFFFFFCKSICARRFVRIAPIRVANRWAIVSFPKDPAVLETRYGIILS